VPVKALMRKDILTTDTTLFDYGCGRGDDIRLLEKKGYVVGGWDPYWAPKNKKTKADIVNLGFVLNVIEDPEERSEVLQKAWKLAKGVLVVSTRPPMKHSFKAYSDGFVTGKDTFQKFWKTAELKAWLESELGVQPESSGSSCCMFCYKSDKAKAKLAA
jgi:DNA phosphorothioation-associated putative methyltransferase